MLLHKPQKAHSGLRTDTSSLVSVLISVDVQTVAILINSVCLNFFQLSITNLSDYALHF